MKLDKEAGLIEAIFFLESDPITTQQLSKITNISEDAVKEAVKQLKETLDKEHHGLELIEIGGGLQLAPKQELWDHLKERYGRKNDSRLSKAALETLSIIAYSQPITRGEIENIRGVASDGMIKLLLNRNFIKVVGKKDVPGKPNQYGTTKEFLKAFRLSSIADLPKLDETERERFELNG